MAISQELARLIPDEVLAEEIARRSRMKKQASGLTFEERNRRELASWFKANGPVTCWAVESSIDHEFLGHYTGHIVDIALYLAATTTNALVFYPWTGLSLDTIRKLSYVVYPSTADWVDVLVRAEGFINVTPRYRIQAFDKWSQITNPTILHGYVVDQSPVEGAVTIVRGTRSVPVDERNTPDRRIHRGRNKIIMTNFIVKTGKK